MIDTCNAIVVDGCIVLRGVLIDVHLGRVGQLGELVLWDVREALGLKGLQIGHVLTCEFKSINLYLQNKHLRYMVCGIWYMVYGKWYVH